MIKSGREKLEDNIFDTDLNDENYRNKLFVRIGCKGQTFTKVDFSHSYFENCYFRNVRFKSCDFNGCKFTNCNFQGSSFIGSTFDYAIFEKTYIDSEILNNNCPSYNNLKLKFARTLRVNYQSIGDAESVNKAIKIELEASKEYLHESWNSKSSYYRTKYQGWNRLGMFFRWLYFKIQDIIWGNGENAAKLFKTGFFIWFLTSIIDTVYSKDPSNLNSYWSSFKKMPSIFMGMDKPKEYSDFYLSCITTVRFIGFALFTSIIIKRYNRR